MLIFTTSSIICQNYEPSPYNIKWTADSIPKPLVQDSFNIKNRYKLGFQWSGSSQMSNALYHNIRHGSTFNPDSIDSNFTEEMYAIGQPGIEIDNATFIQYEPTLQTSDYKNFIIRHYDSTNAVFGFNNIHGTILDSSLNSDENYNRLLLYQDSISSYPSDKIVLSDITPKTEFFTFKKPGQLSKYDGTKWNFSINLRRLDLSDNIENNDTILVIKIPYMAIELNGDTVYKNIRFDKLPNNNLATDTEELDYLENRGFAMTTYDHNGANTIDSIVITKRMIGSDSTKRDLTLSSHFSCYQTETPQNTDVYNPRFIPGFEDPLKFELELIHSIDIEVKYYGNCDIGIDWIRIENDKAQEVLRGKYDSLDRAAIEEYVNRINGATKNG